VSATAKGRSPPLFLCIGDIDVDVMIQVDRLPSRDGKVNGALLRRAAGGMAGNVAVALSRLGAAVRILGRIGDDSDGEFALRELEAAGVDTGFVTRLEGVATFSCIALLTPDGEKSLVKLMTEAYCPSAEDLSDRAFQGVSHVHLTSVGNFELCRRALEAARGVGAGASLDIERADCPLDARELFESIRGFDLVFCNAESRRAVDTIIGDRLRGAVRSVITTLGASGAEVETEGLRVSSPGFAADVVDTTGAGDCFAAACLYARIVQGHDWADALRFANRAASLSTTGLGAQSALPTASQVLSMLTDNQA